MVQNLYKLPKTAASSTMLASHQPKCTFITSFYSAGLSATPLSRGVSSEVHCLFGSCDHLRRESPFCEKEIARLGVTTFLCKHLPIFERQQFKISRSSSWIMLQQTTLASIRTGYLLPDAANQSESLIGQRSASRDSIYT